MDGYLLLPASDSRGAQLGLARPRAHVNSESTI
jgi:hypothetical protein